MFMNRVIIYDLRHPLSDAFFLSESGSAIYYQMLQNMCGSNNVFPIFGNEFSLKVFVKYR